MKEKFKSFIRNHKNGIVQVCYYTAGVLVGFAATKLAYGIRYKGCVTADSKIVNKVLGDIPNGTKVDSYGGIIKSGITPENMGKLGDDIISRGCSKDFKFTHIIAIGKDNNIG